MIESPLVTNLRHAVLTERANLAGELFPDLPPSVLEVTGTEVEYNIHPQSLPYKQIKFPQLRELLATEYGLRFQPGDMASPDSLLRLVNRDMSLDDIGQAALDGNDPELRFESGLVRISEDQALVLGYITFGSETVRCRLAGRSTTRAGEQVVTEIIRFLWALAGVSRSWPECEVDVQVLRFGTGTRVKFPGDAMGLLSPSLRAAVVNWSSPTGIAQRMGGQLVEIDESPREPAQYWLDELHIDFNRRIGGSRVASRLRIGVDRRSDQSTGRLTVTSELPFPDHIQLIEELVALTTP